MRTGNAQVVRHLRSGKRILSLVFSGLALCLVAALVLLPAPAFSLDQSASSAASSSSASASSTSSEAVTVKVGYYYNSGYMHKDENGDYAGFDVEYLYTIAGYANWKIQFVPFDNISEAFEALDAGQIDMMTNLSKTAERQEKYLFSNQRVSQSHISVMTRTSDERYTPGDAATLADAQAAVLKNTLPETLYVAWCAENGLTPHVIECDSLEERDELLASGQADAVVAGTMIKGTQKIAEFPGVDLYAAFGAADATLKSQFDKASATLLLENPDFTTTLQEKYFPNSKSTVPTFSAKEKEYIAAHPAIKVAVLADDAPYSYQAADGTVVGILPEYYAHLSDVIGMRFECVTYHSADDAYAALAAGDIDMLGMVRNDVYEANVRNTILTSSLLEMSMVQITRVGTQTTATAAVDERDYPLVKKELDASGSSLVLKEYDNASAGFGALKAGSVDSVVCSQTSAAWLLNRNRLSDYSIASFNVDSWGVSAACHTGDDGNTLRIIVDKALTVDDDYINQLVTSNTLRTANDLSDIVNRISVQSVVALAVLFILAMAVVIIALAVIVRRRKHEADLADQKAAADKREAELAADERANESQRNFFATVSHDMRTPLNGIMGYSELALEAQDPQTVCDYLEKIKTSGGILADLVNDTLVMSRVESGKLTLTPTPNDNVALMDAICSPIRVMAEEKGVRFVEDIDIRRRTVLVDRLNLQKIFLNLLSNAVKFTPAGQTVTLSVALKPVVGPDPDTILIVKDTGVGMTAEFLPHAFEPFAQEDPANAGTAGTGLGLSIVKSLVEAMGGTIAAESAKGVGTTFTVRLHFKETDQPPVADAHMVDAAQSVEAGALRGKKVLICEDNPMNLEIIKSMLGKYGIDVVGCPNGEEGVKAFEASTEGEYYAVLLDLRMPVMDGEEAARAIRALPREDARRVLILAVSADAFPENVRRCLDAGMDGHVAKPIDAGELVKALLSRPRPFGEDKA